MEIKYHFTVIATDGGLERAENELKGRNIISKTEKEVASLIEYQGSAADRFKTYFLQVKTKKERKKLNITQQALYSQLFIPNLYHCLWCQFFATP